MVNSTVKIVRSELKDLTSNVVAFGQYDATTSLNKMDLVETVKEIEENAPNLAHFIDSVAGNQRMDHANRHIRQEQPGRIVTITAMLSLGRARKSANMFSRALGVYLHGSGVRRRVLSTLHGLGMINSYRTLIQTNYTIAEDAKVSVY